MTLKKTKNFVVDADVAAACSENEYGKICLDFLFNMRHICHKIVITKKLNNEWKKHASKIANEWLTSMKSKGKIIVIDESSLESIEEKINNSISNEGIKNIMLKDSHLVSTALKADKIIVSLDKKARNHFSKLGESIPELSKIYWVNPNNGEDAIQWLKDGAKNDKRFKLIK
jgi:hypothetical protein